MYVCCLHCIVVVRSFLHYNGWNTVTCMHVLRENSRPVAVHGPYCNARTSDADAGRQAAGRPILYQRLAVRARSKRAQMDRAVVRRPTTTQWCACICASRSQGPDLSLIINLLAVAEVHACMHGNYVLLATVFTSRDQRTRDTAGRRASTVKVRRHACTQSLVLTCVPHILLSLARALGAA